MLDDLFVETFFKKIFVGAGRGVVAMTGEKTMIEEMTLRVAEKRNKFFSCYFYLHAAKALL